LTPCYCLDFERMAGNENRIFISHVTAELKLFQCSSDSLVTDASTLYECIYYWMMYYTLVEWVRNQSTCMLFSSKRAAQDHINLLLHSPVL
jgi:hypothetical protein